MFEVSNGLFDMPSDLLRVFRAVFEFEMIFQILHVVGLTLQITDVSRATSLPRFEDAAILQVLAV